MIYRVSLAAGGVVGMIFGLLLYHLGNVAVWLPAAVNEGRELERTAALTRSMEIIKERMRTDAQVNGLTDAGICGELGGVLKDGRCD